MYTHAEKKVDYTFSLYPIPYGDKLQIQVKTPGSVQQLILLAFIKHFVSVSFKSNKSHMALTRLRFALHVYLQQSLLI